MSFFCSLTATNKSVHLSSSKSNLKFVRYQEKTEGIDQNEMVSLFRVKNVALSNVRAIHNAKKMNASILQVKPFI